MALDAAMFGMYNCLDTTCTYEIRDAFWDEFVSTDNMFAYNNTIGIYEPLMYMMTRGIKVNFNALESTRRDVVETRNKLQEELNELCGRELNVNSPKDCQRYFYGELGIKPYTNAKTGNYTTDDKAMQRIARGTQTRQGLKQASLVQEIRGLQKLLGTYLEINFDDDGRLRCSYNPRGTRTGRLSSSKTIYDTGTNQQNLPPEFKKFLVADEGCIFVEMDKRQAEWVVVAYLSEDANMLDVVENGLDPHTHTAQLMFNISPELIKAEAKMVSSSTDPDFIKAQRAILSESIGTELSHSLPRTMSIRQCGKKSNHGLNYDEGYSGFSLINEIEIPESKRIVELYHTIYPNIRQKWYKRIQADLARDRTVTNCFGRKYYFLDAWGDSLFKAAYAYQPQSTVVDGLNLGMQSIYNSKLSILSNVEILTQVHDSILIQIPISDLPNLYAICKQCDDYVSPDMTYYGRTFKLKTDFKIGLNWGAYNSERNPDGMRDLELSNAKQTTDFAEGVYNDRKIPE